VILACAAPRVISAILFATLACGVSAQTSDNPKSCRVADACYSACAPTRNCDLHPDTRDCSRNFPFGNINDPACEASKAAQNSIYAIQKSSCEASINSERSQCESQKAACLSVANACSSILLGKGSNIKGKVVLWVDDHPDNNIYQRQALSEVGARVILAGTTTEGLSDIKGQHVDVVISDFERADDPRAAYTLMAEIRKIRNPPPFIIFSASSTPQFAAEAKRKGALGETNETRELFALVSESVKRMKPGFQIPNFSAVHYAGFTFVFNHEPTFAPLESNLYVLPDMPTGKQSVQPYTGDKQKAERYAKELGALFPSCHGQRVITNDYDILCFKVGPGQKHFAIVIGNGVSFDLMVRSSNARKMAEMELKANNPTLGR